MLLSSFASLLSDYLAVDLSRHESSVFPTSVSVDSSFFVVKDDGSAPLGRVSIPEII